jgi:hypothetical protein
MLDFVNAASAPLRLSAIYAVIDRGNDVLNANGYDRIAHFGTVLKGSVGGRNVFYWVTSQ